MGSSLELGPLEIEPFNVFSSLLYFNFFSYFQPDLSGKLPHTVIILSGGLLYFPDVSSYSEIRPAFPKKTLIYVVFVILIAYTCIRKMKKSMTFFRFILLGSRYLV